MVELLGNTSWVCSTGVGVQEKPLVLWGRSGWAGLELGSTERERVQFELGPKRSERGILWISLVFLPGAL